MKKHVLPTPVEDFALIQSGERPYAFSESQEPEITVGDLVMVREVGGLSFTGHSCERRVTHILANITGMPGQVILSFGRRGAEQERRRDHK